MSSSSTPSPSSISLSPLPTDTSIPSNNGGLSGTGGNYFYGFLVTFIGLLLIFVSCGVNIRRRRRRNDPIGEGAQGWLPFTVGLNPTSYFPATLAALRAEEEAERLKEVPVMFEPRLAKVNKNGEATWSEIMPISIILAQETQSKLSDTPSHSPPPVRQLPSRNPYAIHGLSLPTVSKPEEPKEKPKQLHSLQVAVMIAMPSPVREEKDESTGEYEFGVTSVPWSVEKGVT